MIEPIPPPERPRTALVTGGSGFVGGRLITKLLERGWNVRALARSPQSGAQVRALGATPVTGSLDDERALRSAMVDCEVVFHVAAHFKLWGKPTVFEKANVDGSRNVVRAAAATASVRRVVAVSAAAVVMGDPEPMVDVDETFPLQIRAFAPYSSSKAEGERVLLAANRTRPDFETIALRTPLIWGPGCRPFTNSSRPCTRGAGNGLTAGSSDVDVPRRQPLRRTHSCCGPGPGR